MSYFMVKGCTELFTSKEEADNKALYLANKYLEENLILSKETTVQEGFYDSYGNYEIINRTVISKELKPISSKEELLDLITEFDYILSTYVVELFYKEKLLPS